jgi:hypothetical protein
VVVLGLAGACADIVLFLLPDLLRGIPLEIQAVVRHPPLWIALAIPMACLGAERFAGWCRRGGRAPHERRDEENHAAVAAGYQALDVGERVKYVCYADYHDSSPEARQAAIAWLSRWLSAP